MDAVLRQAVVKFLVRPRPLLALNRLDAGIVGSVMMAVAISATPTAATARGQREACCPGTQYDGDTSHPSTHFHRSTDAPGAPSLRQTPRASKYSDMIAAAEAQRTPLSAERTVGAIRIQRDVGSMGLKLARTKSIATAQVAAIEPGFEPSHALRRGAVRKRFGNHVASRSLLQPIIPHRARRRNPPFDVLGVDHPPLLSGWD